ncbi:hypothetical protein [Streptomyces sp. Ncost-T10-10d]|uniref:hypothetical protein n=1 Tax=Streptomyces sp. Ncost-T10-10d TaxID=1839774 RepID=UPI00114D156D|nr:hypothetical protein [Streptomyces sp. Ncost-T10-10d]
MSDLLERVTPFRAAFARRQASETVELPGAFVVRDPDFSRSQEHNQLIVHASDADPAALPELAAQGLGPRRQHRITVLDEVLGERATPVLAAADYDRDTELILARETAGCALPEPAAHPAELAELRAAVFRQQLDWGLDEDLARQLTERRTARLRGAEKVSFLATRAPDGEIFRAVGGRPGHSRAATRDPHTALGPHGTHWPGHAPHRVDNRHLIQALSLRQPPRDFRGQPPRPAVLTQGPAVPPGIG